MCCGPTLSSLHHTVLVCDRLTSSLASWNEMRALLILDASLFAWIVRPSRSSEIRRSNCRSSTSCLLLKRNWSSSSNWALVPPLTRTASDNCFVRLYLIDPSCTFSRSSRLLLPNPGLCTSCKDVFRPRSSAKDTFI